MPETNNVTPTDADGAMDALIKAARADANSWTLDMVDARWVAREAARRAGESPSAVWPALHKHLAERGPYWPSAREVSAICKAVLAATEAR